MTVSTLKKVSTCGFKPGDLVINKGRDMIYMLCSECGTIPPSFAKGVRAVCIWSDPELNRCKRNRDEDVAYVGMLYGSKYAFDTKNWELFNGVIELSQ